MRVIDLFCGCGGMSIGFRRAGFEIVAAVDNWEAALTVYRMNLKGHAVLSLDLTNAAASAQQLSQYDASVVIGGPPCQDFSSAGKRDESLGRANLTVSFARIVTSLLPEFFIMENVARSSNSQSVEKAKALFSRVGYGLTEAIIDASYCGVPQRRKRYFLIGELWGKDGALNSYLASKLSTRPLTLREYFKDELPFEYYYRHPRSYARRAVFSVDEPSPTIRGVNRPIPTGYGGHPGDPVDVSTIRPMTTKERSLVQTFPKSFKFVGTKSEVEQMVGNAVPVKLAEFVADALSRYIADRSSSDLIRERRSA